MEQFRNEIITNVRSCLTSTKGKIPLKQLEDDYRTLLGERIPYAKLGYKNLESFIASVPSLITMKGPNGQTLVDAQQSDKTAHISDMVQKQKSSSRKKSVKIPPRYNRQYSRPPSVPKTWRPQKNNFWHDNKKPSNSYRGNSSRLAAVSHNQFVHTSYEKPKVPSKIVVPEKKVTSPPRVLSESNGVSNMDETGNKDLCSPLASTKKRITRLMSEINLDRDSGNSSPTTEYAVSSYNKQEFTRSGDIICDLRNFAAYHKLGDVEVKFTETKPKHSKIMQYHCRIKVGQHTYSSYPEDFFNREAAEKHASQKAFDDLRTKYTRRKSLLISSNDDILERIPPMLEKHQTAVWMWQIEEDYMDIYSEQLPSDWIQVIDSSLHVSVEKLTKGYILKHCNPDDVLQKGKKLNVSLSFADVSVPSNTVQFGDDNRLYALVTTASSSSEIWCQHCATPEYEKFVVMSESMDSYYTNHKAEFVPKTINGGCCYVAFHDSNWLRVRALSNPEDGYVDCFLIDYGEQVQIPVDNVCMLKREFAVVQAQAFVCQLSGLEDLYEASIDSDHLLALVGKEYVLEMVVDESVDNSDVTIPIVMYDINTGASINEELISLLTIDSAMPVLDKNSITEVYVSNIEQNGDVYVQIHTPGYYSLLEMLKNLESTLSKNPPVHLLAPVTKESSENMIYLVKCKITKRWLRATIVDWSPRGDLAQIYFLDYGNTDVVNVANEMLFPLNKLDDVCSQYPPQAIKVRMMIEKIPEDFVERAKKLMVRDQMVLLKIISYDNENVAWVEFFKRSSDGGLFCINKSITVEAELQNIDVSSNNEKTSRKRMILAQFNDGIKNVPSGGSLKKPDLPKKGAYFNVNIPFAVNPWNFFVQPLDTLEELTSLMADMQERYKDVQFSPLQIEDIVPGKIYASRHEDGLWYRTSVLKVIHSGCISVFYCDFGYYTSLTVVQLIPLDAKYMNFPYQALKAKIAGIKPSKNKWTMEDCEIFNNLVTRKQFVSVLVDVEKDELHKSDLILNLLLIDTSSEDDINIKDVLIQRGIAINNV